MNQNANDFSFLDKFTDTPVKPAKDEYQAFSRESKTSPRIRIINLDGSTVFLAYRHLTRHYLTDPDTLLALLFSDGVIILEGENLLPLANALMDEKIKTITCFNPARHTPAPASDPIINKITEQTLKEFRGES